MVSWIEDLEAWNGAPLPAVLIARAASPDERRLGLRRLAASAIGCPLDTVVIDHAPNRRPLLVAPAGTGLNLSTASRGGIAAAAVGPEQVGVDVEVPTPSVPVPWNVLHPAEQALLRAEDREAWPASFARLWAAKEAYLKAIRTGLAREPASFQVSFVGATGLSVDDPVAPAPVALGEVRWVPPAGRAAAGGFVAVVMLSRSWP